MTSRVQRSVLRPHAAAHAAEAEECHALRIDRRALARKTGADYSHVMLKSLLLTLLVLGGPVQAQLAHFCDVMERAVETCCCSHDEQPVQQAPASCPEGIADPCCRTVVSLVVDEAAAAITPAGKQGVSAHDPPPLAPPPNASLPRGNPCTAPSVARSRPDVFGQGARTYLRTLRLRL